MAMEGGKRMYTEAMVVVILGMMMWLSMTIMPSTAQTQPSPDFTCWDKFLNCSEANINDTSNAELNPKSLSFNATKFLCCDLLQEAALNKPCFCAIDPFIHEHPANRTIVLKVFAECTILPSDSLVALDMFCAGSIPSTAAGTTNLLQMGTTSSLTRVTLKMTQQSGNSQSPTTAPKMVDPKTGASNKIAFSGTISGIFLLFTYFLYY